MVVELSIDFIGDRVLLLMGDYPIYDLTILIGEYSLCINLVTEILL